MDLPKRHRNHVLENISKISLMNIIPEDWILHEYQIDYGTDFNCEIVENDLVNGLNFSIQLKSKEKEKNLNYTEIKGLKRSTINRWLKRLEPTMIVVYVKSEDKLYWKWIEDNTFDLTKVNKTFGIKIPKQNLLEKAIDGTIQSYIEQIFKRRHLLYDIPKNKDSTNEAWELYLEGEYEQALLLFKKETKNQSDLAPLTNNAIAVCEYYTYRYKEALLSINYAISKNKSSQLLLMKATILTELGKENNDQKLLLQAIDIYNRILEEEDNIPDYLFYNYGNCLYDIEDWHKSIDMFIYSLQINPNKAETWNSLGNALNKIGNHIAALDAFEEAIKIDDKLYQALYNKGQTLYQYFGSIDIGLKFMLKSIQVDSENRAIREFPYVYFWISEAYLDLNKKEKALAANKKGLDAYPNDTFFVSQKMRIKEFKND